MEAHRSPHCAVPHTCPGTLSCRSRKRSSKFPPIFHSSSLLQIALPSFSHITSGCVALSPAPYLRRQPCGPIFLALSKASPGEAGIGTRKASQGLDSWASLLKSFSPLLFPTGYFAAYKVCSVVHPTDEEKESGCKLTLPLSDC